MTRILTALVSALLASTALAQEAKPGFDNVDINRDGVITLAEFATLYPHGGATTFRDVDRNDDGRLTITEYASVSVSYRVGER